MANALSDAGVGEGDAVAILCRNHRGFIESVVACSKLGAHALFLNTMFAGPQITDVCERRPRGGHPRQRFTALCDGAGEGRMRFIAWTTTAPRL